MIILDSKAQLIVDVVSKVAQGKIRIVNAAKLLKSLAVPLNVTLLSTCPHFAVA